MLSSTAMEVLKLTHIKQFTVIIYFWNTEHYSDYKNKRYHYQFTLYT